MTRDHLVPQLLLAGALLLTLCACWLPEREYIVQTSVITRTDCPPPATQVAIEVVTPTPPQPAPPDPPPTIRVLLDAGRPASDAVQRKLGGLLRERTGYDIEIVVSQTDSEAVQGICSGLADVAWVSVPAYIVAHDTCQVEAVFSVVHSGGSAQRSQIMVQDDNLRQARGLAPIRSLADLDGSTIGFTDALSITGHLAPKAMLVQAGAMPREELFLGGDPQAVLAVFRGEIDAAAGTWRPPQRDGTLGDSRASLLPAMPEAVRSVKIIALSEPIPNEPVVFRAELPTATRERLVLAFVALTTSPDGRDVLARMGGIEGLVPTSDSDYDIVRAMGESMRLDFEKLLERRTLH